MKQISLVFVFTFIVCSPPTFANSKKGELSSTLTKGTKEVKGSLPVKPLNPQAIKTDKENIEHFKNTLKQYQQSLGVQMAFNKQAYFPLLKKRQTPQGEIFLSKKKILLKLKDHLNTQVLFDGKKWWHIILPQGETKRVSAIQPDQNISLLFQPESFFQHFRFISQEIKGRTQILYFLPKSKTSPLKSLTVQIEQNRILKVWLKWQGSNNEEVFSFFNIRFNQKLSSTVFSKPK